MQTWGSNFRRIVARYENTIRAQFYGHTHKDHYQVQYADDVVGARPVSVAHVFPSVTTESVYNSGFSIVTADGLYDGSSWVPRHCCYFF